MALFPSEKTCAICRKKFLGHDGWVFKRGESWYCSWSCLREHERQSKARKYGQRLNKEDKETLRKMLEAGVKLQRIAERMNITVNAVQYYQNQLKTGT